MCVEPSTSRAPRAPRCPTPSSASPPTTPRAPRFQLRLTASIGDNHRLRRSAFHEEVPMARRALLVVRWLAVAIVAVGISVPSAHAAPILEFTGGAPGGPGANQFTFGWGFSVSDPLSVSALGVWDEGDNGLLRSEEHTSEIQSPCNLVCRLLLDTK